MVKELIKIKNVLVNAFNDIRYSIDCPYVPVEDNHLVSCDSRSMHCQKCEIYKMYNKKEV